MLMQQQGRFRLFCICRMQDMAERLIVIHLSIRDDDLIAYRAMWDELLTLSDMADVYYVYRND